MGFPGYFVLNSQSASTVFTESAVCLKEEVKTTRGKKLKQPGIEEKILEKKYSDAGKYKIFSNPHETLIKFHNFVFS